MMIYLELLAGFWKVGFFSFGGTYGAIPLIREVVSGYGWLTDEALGHMIALSEAAPGPMMVNLAAYIGSSQGGLVGAIFATLALLTPLFLLVLAATALIQTLHKSECFQTVLGGVKACAAGVILATGVELLTNYLCPGGAGGALSLTAVWVTVILAVLWLPLKLLGRRFAPLIFFFLAACLGVVFYW